MNRKLEKYILKFRWLNINHDMVAGIIFDPCGVCALPVAAGTNVVATNGGKLKNRPPITLPPYFFSKF